MPNNRKNYQYVGRRLVGLIAFSLLIGACSGVTAGPTIAFEVYESPFTTPEQAVTFSGTPIVVVAVVTGSREARWNGKEGHRPTASELASNGRPEFVWVPVDIRITQVLRGDVDNEALILRSLGGRIGDVTVDFGDNTSLPVLDPGTMLVLFLNPPVDAGDGLIASTPNHVYIVEGNVAKSSNGTHEIGLDQLIEMIRNPPLPSQTETGDGNTTTTTLNQGL